MDPIDGSDSDNIKYITNTNTKNITDFIILENAVYDNMDNNNIEGLEMNLTIINKDNAYNIFRNFIINYIDIVQQLTRDERNDMDHSLVSLNRPPPTLSKENKILSDNMFMIIKYALNILIIYNIDYTKIKHYIVSYGNYELIELLNNNYFDGNDYDKILNRTINNKDTELFKYIIQFIDPIINKFKDILNMGRIEFLNILIQYIESINNKILINKLVKILIYYIKLYYSSMIKDIIEILYELIEKHYNIIEEDTYMLFGEIYDEYYEDIIRKVFEILLSKEGYPEIVFKIIEFMPVYAIQLAEVTISDPDYHIYINKYLNILLDLMNSNDIIDENEYKKTNYHLAKVLMEKHILSKLNKRNIISYLIDAKDYADAKPLRTRLSQVYYLNEDIGQNPQFPINVDKETILNLLERIHYRRRDL